MDSLLHLPILSRVFLFEPLDLLDLLSFVCKCVISSYPAGVPHAPGRCEKGKGKGKGRRIRRTRTRVGRTRSPVSAATAATSTTAADGPRQPSLRMARTARTPTHQLTNQPLPKLNRAEQINCHRLEHLDHPAGWVLPSVHANEHTCLSRMLGF